jgi:iron complex outermembrane recepter protein
MKLRACTAISPVACLKAFYPQKCRLVGMNTALLAIKIIVLSNFFNAHHVSFAQAAPPLETTRELTRETTRETTLETTLKPITISAEPARARSDVAGFGDVPLSKQPISASVITAQDIRESGAQRLADLYRFDASIADAYNAIGYIDYATVRGFVIDNKTNVRRDSLPIYADTAIGLANKERVDILKGTSGIQAGVSAPGGLINYGIKRPGTQDIRSLELHANGEGQYGAAVDLGGRWGASGAQGWRLNAALDRLNSSFAGTRGNRQQLALALESRIGRDALLEAEVEWSRQSQPNVPGYSLLSGLLGAAGSLPSANTRINLNTQAWSQPTVFEGLTGSLRYEQALSGDWRWSLHAGGQRLRTDDRLAFPFGCTAENVFDRFCSNGDVDLYDYRSEGERRHKNAMQFKLQGIAHTGRIAHDLSFGVLRASGRITTPDYAYNYAGTINLLSPVPVPESPAPIASTGNRQTEKSTELAATTVSHWSSAFKTWLGLRHIALKRSDALSQARYSQSFLTPWLAMSYSTSGQTWYASHGHGIETDIAPLLSTANPGAVLPARRSRQNEIGVKGSVQAFMQSRPQTINYQATLFQIDRPVSNLDACGLSGNFSCLVRPDGLAQHRGLELSAQWQQAAWQLGGSATWLQARRQGSTENAAINGLRPVNVPRHILRANAAYRLHPDWQIAAHISHEARRAALPDNSVQLPAWTRVDASLRWQISARGESRSALQLSVHNLFNRRYFQESPYQFSHSYLFPAAPRSLRLSWQTSL